MVVSHKELHKAQAQN